MTPHNPVSRKRSGQRTVDKLLRAALYLFDAGGTLSTCTVERVAAEARVSQGRIYRRYDSNDAFLSAIFLRYLHQAYTTSPEELFASLYRPTLDDTAERVIANLLRPYQNHPQIHRAIEEFQRQRPETAFVAQAPAILEEYMRNVAAVLVPHRDLFPHPDPERSSMIAVLQSAWTIEETFLSTGPEWDTALPRSTQLLIAERTRALIAYLRSMPQAGPVRNQPYTLDEA